MWTSHPLQIFFQGIHGFFTFLWNGLSQCSIVSGFWHRPGLVSSLESSGLTVSRNGCKECCGHGLVVEHHRGPGPFFGRKEPLLVGTGQQTHAKKYFVRLHLGTLDSVIPFFGGDAVLTPAHFGDSWIHGWEILQLCVTWSQYISFSSWWWEATIFGQCRWASNIAWVHGCSSPKTW